MVSTTALQQAIAVLLQTDAATLGGALKIHLAKASFTPSATLGLGDLTEADFDGYAPQVAACYQFAVLVDPTSGLLTLELYLVGAPPIFLTSKAFLGPTQTIYGYYLTDGANTKLFASATFTTPVPVPADDPSGLTAGVVFMPQMTLKFSNSSPN